MNENLDKSLFEEISENRENFSKGILNYVPIQDLGQFTEWFPGFMRGDVSCITGTPASSKSSFSRLILEHSAIPWAIQNNKNLHIIRFGLEESKRQNLMSLLSYQIYKDHKIEYNIKDFLSVGRTVEEKHLPLIKESEAKLNQMLKYLTYEDSTYNSFGFWKKVRTLAQERGKFFKAGKQVDNLDQGWDSYKANDPEEYVIIILDNLSYVTPDKEEVSPYNAVWNAVEYLRKFAANKLNYIVVFLQHQDSSSENQESRKEKTILPTENGLAIHKGVARGYLNLIGIANPNKVNTAGVDYVVRTWDGHDLKNWENYIRTLNILKSRFGMANVNTSVFTAGRSGHFSKIPPVGSQEYKDFVTNLKNYK